ncbi:hypothetical protein GCM10027590_16150 [Nocardiopsis nanhaiensis]
MVAWLGIVLCSGCGISGPSDPRGALTGKILSADGHPIGECSISPEPLDIPDDPIPEKGYRSSADGTFRVSLPEGEYHFTFICPTEPDGHSQEEEKKVLEDIFITSGEETGIEVRMAHA